MAIGTTAAIIGAAAIGAAGSVASGVMGANAAKKAGDAQARAADSAAMAQVEAAQISAGVQREGLQFQKDTYAMARDDAAPWMAAGREALDKYRTELGLQGGNSAFKETPGYRFMVGEGEKGVINNLAALGMKNSGAALKALTRFRTGLANQTYDNYLNRLQGAAGMGQAQVNSLNSLGNNVAGSVQAGLQGIGNTYQDAGQARASGYLNAGQAKASGIMGAANAWQNALSSGVGNVSNALGMLARPQAVAGLY